MNELFTIEESKSPRLRWMETHGIQVADSGIDHEDGDECEITGNQCYRFWAFIGGKITKSESMQAGGHTEADAVFALAEKLQLRLWNEA